MLAPIMAAPSGNVELGFVYTPAVDDDEAVARGCEAAKRIIAGAHVADWLDIGFAIAAGARVAEAEAGGQTSGKAYCTAFARWLDQHPELELINEHERAGAVWATRPENWPAVQKFLAGLEPDKRNISMRALKRRLGPAPKPRQPKPESVLTITTRERDEYRDQLADTKERLAAFETDRATFSVVAEAPETVAAALFRHHRAWANRLKDALNQAFEERPAGTGRLH